MSFRSFGDAKGRKNNGNVSKAKGRIRAASLSAMEPLEQRQMLNAVVVPFSSTVGAPGAPLAPRPGQSFWVDGRGTAAAYQAASAVTPNTVNDLVLNVTAFAQNYTACCEANGGNIGNTGSVNAGRLFTNGLSQNQIGGFPATGALPAVGSGGTNDNSSGSSVLSQNGTAGWWLAYNLGTAPGQTASSTGYDLSEIDVISGHQDTRTGFQDDIMVQFVNGNTTDWFSLSNGRNFNFTQDGTAQLQRGSAQMAIVNNVAGPMVSNVRSVKFVANNQQTWFRELVVTGTASPGLPPGSPGTMPAPSVTADPTPGRIGIAYTLATNGFSYDIQRALVTNGTPGSFSSIGGAVTFVNPGSFVDGTAAAGSTYVYRIVASNPNGSTTSATSAQISTPPISVEAHYYNMGFWEGPVTVNQGVSLVNLSNGGSWANGIRGSQDSAVFTGKITTNAAGVYTIMGNTDDDGYLYVNGVLVSSDPGGHGQRNPASQVDINGAPLGTYTPIQLAANTAYDFVLLEHNSGGGAGANIVWVTPSTVTPSVVQPANLSPQSSAPSAPQSLTVTSSNSNFVNFTFAAENNAVVHYILQRALAGSTNWATINQIDPGSDAVTKTTIGVSPNTIGVVTGQSRSTLTIQDAAPIPGQSYIYRVAAVNFDGVATSPTAQATLASVSDLVSPPVGAPTFGTAAGSPGLSAGTYFVEYSWINANGGETAASAEATTTLGATGDLIVTLPAAPAGATQANVYVSNLSTKERLSQTINAGQTARVRGLPFSVATAAPTANNAGLAPTTYFVAYTWVGDNTTTTGESAYDLVDPVSRNVVSNEKTIVLGSRGDVVVSGFPAAPAGVGSVNVYIGTSSRGERLAGNIPTNGSLTIRALPAGTAPALPVSQNNSTAPVSNVTGTVGIPLVAGNSQGVEIHRYNAEMFGRFGSPAANNANAFALAQNGLATQYVAQTTIQSFNPNLGGPIDRNYGDIIPSGNPLPAPNSPDNTKFPDIERIHTENFAQAFTGTVTTNLSGTYTIISNSDDDGYTWLNGTLVSADPGGHGQQDASVSARSQDTVTPVFLQQGQTYNLAFFMGQGGGGSGAHLKWIAPSANSGNPDNVTPSSNSGSQGATIHLGSAFASGSDGFYNNFTIFITSGPGAGQAARITSYTGSTKTASVDVTTGGNNLLWSTLPTGASQYTINMVEMVPLLGSDPITGGGLQLHEQVPNQSTWDQNTGIVNYGGDVTNHTTPVTTASAAQSLTVAQVSATSGVTLTWSDQSTSELWYEVQRATDGTNFTTIGTTPMNIGTSFVDPTATNAFNSTTISYFYRVRGVNFDGAGAFTPVVNTSTNVQIAAPTIVSIVQGAPGTAGIIMSGGSPNAGGLDIQYATLNGTTTGSFVDATPLALPFNTFDYQVTGLTNTQQYVFRVSNAVGGNNAIAIFSAPKNFTPTGGVVEAFGTPGTGVGGFTTLGDLQLNGNASLTGAGTPAAPAPTATAGAFSAPDINNPNTPATITVTADVPAPTQQGAATTSANNLNLSNAASFFLEYTWVTANGETLPGPVLNVPNPGWTPSIRVGETIFFTVPAGAPAGAQNANVYIGTSSNPTDLLRAGTVAPGATLTITSFPAANAATVPTTSATGVVAGTYYVQYSWLNANGQETAGSTEQTVPASNTSNDITIALPSVPPPSNAQNITSANIYIGTAPGAERLIQNSPVAGGTVAPLTVRGLPAGNAKQPLAVNAAGLLAGTYFVQYSWVSSEPNQAFSAETVPSPLSSVVISGSNNDLGVNLPAAPNGVSSANIYVGYKIPDPTSAATAVATTGGSLAAGTYYVNYEWYGTDSAAGAPFAATLPSTSETTVVIPSAGGGIKVTPPGIPYGASGAKVFIGTVSGSEQFSTNATGGQGATPTVTINSLPAASAFGLNATNTTGSSGLTRVGNGAGGTNQFFRTLALGGTLAPIASPATGTLTTSVLADVVNPTAAASISAIPGSGSLAVGTYYVQYSWLGSTSGETAGSPEQTVTASLANTQLSVTLPAAPAGAGNGRVYIGSAPGAERLAGSGAGGSTVNINALPATTAAAVPTTNTIGMPAGTYYVAFTWTSGNGLETAPSAEQTLTMGNLTNDLVVTIPTAPIGAGSARVYLGTAPGQEFFAGSANALSSLTIKTLPNINARMVPPANTTSNTLRYFTPANALRLTDNNNSQTSSAFNRGLDVSQGFTTSFDFQLTGNMSADGFGFVIQDNTQGAIGGGGGSLGYNNPNIGHSVGVFFQTFTGSPNVNQTGLGVNGNRPGDGNGASSYIAMNIANNQPTGVIYTSGNAQDQRIGDVFNVSLAYDANTKVLTETVKDLTLNQRTGNTNVFTTTYSIDIAATLGMPAGFAGFTAASGGASSEKDILNWSLTAGAPFTDLNVITGTPFVDQITLKKDGDGTHMDWNITRNGVVDPVNYRMLLADLNGLTVNGLGSNDVITIDNTNGNPLPNLTTLNGRFTVNGLTALGADPLSGKTMDIKNSTLFVSYPTLGSDPIAAIKGYLTKGYNGGDWNGTSATAPAGTGAIRSSTSAADSAHLGIGYADNNDGTGGNTINPVVNTIKIQFAALGDTDLDGTVGLSDYTAVVRNFGTGTNWDQGAVTYGGTVNLNDYTAVVRNFGQTATAQAAPAAAAASSSSTATSSNSSLANVTPSVTLNPSSSSNTGTADNSTGGSVVDSTSTGSSKGKKGTSNKGGSKHR